MPSGMRKSAFSSVGNSSILSGRKGREIIPLTAFPSGFAFLIRLIIMAAIFVSVGVIDSEQCTGEGCDLSESDKERLVDLSFGSDERATEEKNEST